MNIFWIEFKKFFTWPVIILALVANVLLFQLLISFDLKYFPNGRPAKDLFGVEREMIEKYGESLNGKEYQDFVSMYEKRVADADEFLQKNQKAIAAAVSTYQEYRNSNRDNQAIHALQDYLMFEEGIDLFWELQARESVMESYKYRVETLEAEGRDFSDKGKERVQEMITNGKFSYYESMVLDNFSTYSSNVLIIILFTISIVLSPIFLRDKMRRVIPLQYTSKIGRRIFNEKYLAGLVMTGLLLTLLVIIYSGLYLTNDTSRYFFMHLYSMSLMVPWYDLTFAQYITLTIIAIYVIGFIFGIITMMTSAIVKNYIAQIGCQIVTISAFIWLIVPICVERMIWVGYMQWVVPCIYSASDR